MALGTVQCLKVPGEILEQENSQGCFYIAHPIKQILSLFPNGSFRLPTGFIRIKNPVELPFLGWVTFGKVRSGTMIRAFWVTAPSHRHSSF